MNHKALKLNKFEKMTHYAPVLFLLSISLAGIITPIVKPSHRSDIFILIIFPLIPGVLAIFAYWWQKRVLRFRLFHTPHSSEENYNRVLQLFEKKGWTIKQRHHSQFVQAAVPGYPKSWGELVTVRFLGNDLYVNSICDPAKYPSVTAYGNNRINVLTIVRAAAGSNQSLGDFDETGKTKPEISLIRAFGLVAWAAVIGSLIWLFFKNR
jgi:hypothetical protein